jgi:hypothetical protein
VGYPTHGKSHQSALRSVSVTMQPKEAKSSIPKSVRPDAKHRVGLGSLAEGVSSFDVEVVERGVILLRAKVEVPAHEAWLWKNRKALESVRRGLEQSARGETHDLGSFAKYADE